MYRLGTRASFLPKTVIEIKEWDYLDYLIKLNANKHCFEQCNIYPNPGGYVN
jgi:hypothetical protein